LKPAQVNCLRDPISKKKRKKKNPSQERAGGVAQGVGSEFKPQHCKKTNKQKKNPGND
jgi:hypothetical protein